MVSSSVDGPGPLQPIVGPALGLALRQWRPLLWIAVRVLVPAQLVSFLVPAISSAGGGAIVNGVLVPTEVAQAWTTAWLRLDGNRGEINVSVPIILVGAWVVALVVCLCVLVDRHAWRRAFRLWPAWAMLALLMAMATVLLLLAGFAASAAVGDPLNILAVLVLYGSGSLLLGRLALALPAIVIEQRASLVDALRRTRQLTRCLTFALGWPVAIGAGALPVLVLAAGVLTERALVGVWPGGSWVGGAVAAGVGGLLGGLALVAVVPVQAAVLACAFQSARQATSPEDATDPGQPVLATREPDPGQLLPQVGADRPWTRLGRRGRTAMTAAVALLPAVVSTGYVLANPDHVPVVSVTDAQEWIVSDPLAVGTVDGAVVIVDGMQIIRCHDPLCQGSESISLPCVDGGPLAPVDGGGMSCSIEAPLDAATVRADGTVIALRHGRRNELRLVWCRLTSARRCAWGGATTLSPPASGSGIWSAAVASTPSGGIVATFIRPTGDQGRDELVLASCAELPCADARLSHVRSAPSADGSVGRELLALAVDPVHGHLAIAYWDRRKDLLWLGGCPEPACVRPNLSAIELSAPVEVPLRGGRISLVATAHGPVVATANLSATEATVISCEDAACSSSHQRTLAAPSGGPKLAVDPTGGVVVAAANGEKTRLVLANLSSEPIADGSGALLPLPAAADLIATSVDQRGVLRILLRTPAGLVLMTCADPQCRA